MIKISHRGAGGLAPENTLTAVKKALVMDADMVEIDVRVCESGEVILLHDKKVNRTTNGQGYIEKMNLEEIKRLNVKQEEKIPTLEEVLDIIYKKIRVNIELKGKNTAMPVSEIIKKYKKKSWENHHFLISSFMDQEIFRFYELMPDIELGYIKFFPFRYLNKLERHNIKYLFLYYGFIKKKVIEKIHKRNKKIIAYTVNSDYQIKKLKKMGIDGIVSDYPQKI